jgi:fused signal recognition particle receptor
MFSFFKRKKDSGAEPTRPPDATPEVVSVAPSNLSVAHMLPPDLPDAPAPAPSEVAEESPVSLGERLGKSYSALGGRLAQMLHLKPELDARLLDEIETLLLSADVGVAATGEIVEALRNRVERREINDSTELLAALRAQLVALLKPCEASIDWASAQKPFVLLVIGVNGVGKTTTIGKLARRSKDRGIQVLLAAGDTFRAAAVNQLKTWGERNDVPVIAQGEGADSASVIFDAVSAAKARGAELVIADTAGRLHTQTNLMEELRKVKRVIQKVDPSAPHEVLMVIDGSVGQNAIAQVRQFHAAMGVTGLVITKLDGTAKGGVLFGLAREFKLPIRFIGVGERAEDLRTFSAHDFVRALIPDALAS